MTEIRSMMTEIRSDISVMRSIVAGYRFERAARSELPARLGEVLENPTGARVIVSLVDGTGAIDGAYMDGVRGAQESGAIAPEDALRLSSTDLVLTATVDGEPYMAPVEVSATIDNEDIRRALRSSELIREVFGVESVPVVAGPDIRQASRRYATDVGVGIIILNIDDSRPG